MENIQYDLEIQGYSPALLERNCTNIVLEGKWSLYLDRLSPACLSRFSIYGLHGGQPCGHLNRDTVKVSDSTQMQVV